MHMLKRRITIVIVSVIVVLSAGCATKGGIDVDQLRSMPVESVIGSADQAIAAGDKEKALAILDGGAKAHPTSSQPWIKKARMYFEAENYPSAILAAEEALQRDAANAEASSIALVSSLRIAVKYVSDLRAQAALDGDARPDGERLATKLRETLKEPILVPLVPAMPSAASPATRSPQIQRPKAKRIAPPSNSEPHGASNPFSSLK